MLLQGKRITEVHLAYAINSQGYYWFSMPLEGGAFEICAKQVLVSGYNSDLNTF